MNKDEDVEPTWMDIMFDPAKYGYEVCTHCNGSGFASIKEEADRCTQCAGRGLIKTGDGK